MFLGYTHYILNRYNSLTSNVFSLDFKKDRLPEGWVNIPFKNLVKKIPLTGRKIKQKEYLKNGTIQLLIRVKILLVDTQKIQKKLLIVTYL